MNTYITCFDYLRAPSGQETASLLGNIGHLSSSVSTGATSLPTATLTVALNVYDQVYIFDGTNSEVAIVSFVASIGATRISVQPLQFSHNAGVPYCSDGANGSLASAILQASQRVETFCQQALLQTTYASEQSPLRTLSANITSDGYLHFRTRHFPIQSVSALALVLDSVTTLTLDPTQCVFNSRAMSVDVPIVSTLGSTTQLLSAFPPLTQLDPGWLQYSYVAGYAYTSLPADIQRACVLFTSEILSDRFNPMGAVVESMGKRHISQYARGRTTLESPAQIRAYELLTPYRRLA